MEQPSNFVNFLNRALQASLFLLALSAPLSIAATQTAWSFALLFWIIRAFAVRPTIRKGGIDLAIIAFIGLSIFSSIFSYEPGVSIRKLVSVSLVTIVYLVSENISSMKMLRNLIVIVLLAGSVAAAFAIGIFIVGKNLKVIKLTPDSPLSIAGVLENDTILRANGINVSSPDQLANAIGTDFEAGAAKVTIYRVENIIDFNLPMTALITAGDSAGKFGIVEWSRGHDTRATGFFGHYTTYAEAVQLILSLALGLLIVVPGSLFSRNRILLAAAVGVFCIGLFLTVTRASWAGFLVSAAVMVVIGTSRKTIILCILLAIPVAAGGLFYLQQKRNVGFIDTSDNSTTWRATVWHEGFGVLISSPRHLVVGIGMDSLKTHWMDWHMFENGMLPIGHLHCTPLQIAFERGVPTLIAWLAWMFFYLQLLWRTFRRDDLDWMERGLILGAIGGTAGFLSCGLVHYNWGDSEVVMIFYLLMGLSLSVINRPQISSAIPDPA